MNEGDAQWVGWLGRLQGINPGRHQENCAECAVLTDRMLDGQDCGVAGDVGMTSLGQLERFFGSHFDHYLTAREFEAALAEAGPGARAIIYGHRGIPEAGHLFNAVNHGGVISCLDGQAGGMADLSGFVDGEFSMLRTNL